MNACALSTGDGADSMSGSEQSVGDIVGSAEQGEDFEDRPKKKLGPGRPRKDAGLTPEQRKHRRCFPPPIPPIRAAQRVCWVQASRCG